MVGDRSSRLTEFISLGQTDGLEKVRCVALELYVRSSDSSTTELVDVLKGYLSSKSGIHLKSLTSTPTRKRAHVSRVSPRHISLQNRNCRWFMDSTSMCWINRTRLPGRDGSTNCCEWRYLRAKGVLGAQERRSTFPSFKRSIPDSD